MAISIAAALGAVRIVLLGFDMRVVDGRSNYHDGYGHIDDNLYAHDFLPWFKGWRQMAERAGIEILNATPDSALDEFKKVRFNADGISDLAAKRPLSD